MIYGKVIKSISQFTYQFKTLEIKCILQEVKMNLGTLEKHNNLYK